MYLNNLVELNMGKPGKSQAWRIKISSSNSRLELSILSERANSYEAENELLINMLLILYPYIILNNCTLDNTTYIVSKGSNQHVTAY